MISPGEGAALCVLATVWAEGVIGLVILAKRYALLKRLGAR